MLHAFSTHLKKEQLIAPNDTVLLAVSGGIDSVVMCALFHQSGIPFGIAHCNFQLRGKESDEDEIFAETLAEKYNVRFHAVSFATEKFAKKNKLSIQVAARELRYEWFEQVRNEYGYAAIATAHHSDDSIETFLINLIRGTGIAGLHGILPKQGKIIRPMLFTNKKDIAAFAKTSRLAFREDSSNDSDKYLRNKIRKSIIPALKKLNPSVDTAILKSISHLAGVEQIFRKEVLGTQKEMLRVKNSTVYISISGLKQLDPLPVYLFEILKPYGFNAASAEEILRSLDGISGKQFSSPTHRLIRDRKDLVIQKKDDLQAGKKTITVKKKQASAQAGALKLSFSQLPAGTKFSHSEMSASLDLDTLSFPLTIRKWKKGDAFQPIGMKGKKKLSDFFTDRKLSIAQKEDTWLLMSGKEVAWVIGLRIDDRFKITGKTKKIYFAELTE
jgi:tRNA(Ile)-lysidine synthase